MNAAYGSGPMRCCALLCFGSLLASLAHAESQGTSVNAKGAQRDSGQPQSTWLEIERAQGSEACPDANAVFRAMARLFPERALRPGTTPDYFVASARVKIRPISVGHEALVTITEPRRGERVILENNPNCHGLADALAVTLVMLAETPEPPTDSRIRSDAVTPQSASTSTTEAVSIVKTPPIAPSRPRETHRDAAPIAALLTPAVGFTNAAPPRMRAVRADARAAAVAGLGLLSEPALGAAVGVDLFHKSGWGLTLQGLRLWSRPAKDQGGSVTLTLWAGLAGPCYRQRMGAASSLDSCLRLGLGAQHAEVRGFLAPKSGNFPWLVLEPLFRYTRAFGQFLAGFVGIGAVGQLQPQSFSVRLDDGTEDSAQVADAPKVGLLAELGLTVEGGVF